MPRYYCDYCDTYLTHDSPSVRKQHNSGYKHKANVRSYYQQFEEQQTQSLIDQRVKQHLDQTAAYQQQQVGAVYNPLAPYPQRLRAPILPTPGLPGMVTSQMAPVPGMRPPFFPRPGGPGGPETFNYTSYQMRPPMISPPGAPPMQVNGLPRPPPLSAPTETPGLAAVPTSIYQANPAAPTSGGFGGYNASTGQQMPPNDNASQDGFSFAQASESDD